MTIVLTILINIRTNCSDGGGGQTKRSQVKSLRTRVSETVLPRESRGETVNSEKRK